MKDQLLKIIQKVLTDLSVPEATFTIEHPADISHGDYSTSVALSCAKQSNFKPVDLAKKIADTLMKEKIKYLEKIEVAGPGFINFHLSGEFFAEALKSAIKDGDDYGKNKNLNGKKVIIEYTNTNVLKPFHIGHLMGNIIGESLSRILGWNGAEIRRNTYQGDIGLHIAQAIWGIKSFIVRKPSATASLEEKVAFLGQAYAHGAESYEGNPQAQEEIKKINKELYDKKNNEILDLYSWGREISLAHFENLYKKLGTKFDYYFFESEVADDAQAIVLKNTEKGIFEKSDGATVFKAEKHDSRLHTRVFVTSQGIPTYEAKDIAHALRKYKKFSSDLSIIVTANEQDEYFKVVLTALKLIDPKIADQTKHISHGMLRLTEGKMSSRKGNVITGESLIADVEKLVLEKIKDREFNEKEKLEIAEIVAVGAIKFSILRQSPGKDIIFDFEKSLSFEGDSGPYLQYSYVRARSILEKAKHEKISSKVENNFPTVGHTEKLLARFPEIVERARVEMAPQLIVTYLLEISAAFNRYYAENKIVDKDDPSSSYKVALTKAFMITVKNGLHILGIRVPERM